MASSSCYDKNHLVRNHYIWCCQFYYLFDTELVIGARYELKKDLWRLFYIGEQKAVKKMKRSLNIFLFIAICVDVTAIETMSCEFDG